MKIKIKKVEGEQGNKEDVKQNMRVGLKINIINLYRL